MLFVDANGAEPASGDGGDGQGHDLQVVQIGLSSKFRVLLPTGATNGRLGALESTALTWREGFAGGLLGTGELACRGTSQRFNGTCHVGTEHVAERGHELGVNGVGIALRTSVNLSNFGGKGLLFGRQSVAATVEFVAEGVHLPSHFGSSVASFCVDGFVVAPLTEGTAAVGVGVAALDNVYQRAIIADTLSTGQVNCQVSAAFVAFCHHFSQLQG